MKIELEINDCDALVVMALRQSIKNCVEGSTHPEDKKYAKKYARAANLVIEHFGGELISH